MDIKIITGLSGAGKSTVVNKLEDMGYYCIDNLPPSLLEKFLELTLNPSNKDISKVAIVVDIRGRAFFKDLEKTLEHLKLDFPENEIIFLEADKNTLVNRFKETRRAHPLSIDGQNDGSTIKAIEKEIEITYFLKKMSNLIIDTSSLSKKELELLLIKKFSKKSEKKSSEIVFNSFGFKHGIPLHADMVFDVRFIDNPYYVKELRALSGEDIPVYDYVFSRKAASEYYEKLNTLLEFTFKQYLNEGRSQIIVAMGCTGGRHRSVAFACRLASDFMKKGFNVKLSHRDKNKN